MNISHNATGSLLLTKLAEFLEQCEHDIDASSTVDMMEFLCVVDNSYLASRSNSEKILVDLSEDMLWWHVVRNLLQHLSDVSALCSVTIVRLIVCMLNVLTVVAGSQDVLLIDRACLDESHYLSVFEQQTKDASAEFGDGSCKVASKLLEYRLIDMPLICIRHCTSASFSSETVCKIVDKFLSVFRKIDSHQLSDILVHRRCQKIVGVTWLYPVVMWSLRQRIVMHCYRELSLACQDTSVNDKISLLCNELKAAVDDVDQSVAELEELQENLQYQFERNLFIIQHHLGDYEGEHDVTVSFLRAY